jgi:hypothetical protein
MFFRFYSFVGGVFQEVRDKCKADRPPEDQQSKHQQTDNLFNASVNRTVKKSCLNRVDSFVNQWHPVKIARVGGGEPSTGPLIRRHIFSTP